MQQLGSLERRVLVLRAGVGARAPRSRGRVAGRLDLSVRRVAGLERAGLRRLRTLGRSDRCAGTPSALARAAVPAGTIATGGPARRGGGGGGSPGAGKPGGGGVSASGAGHNGSARQGIGGDFASSPPLAGSPGSAAAWIPIVLAALAALSAGYLAAGGVRTLRARRQ